MSQAAADEVQRRLVSFAVKIIELVVHLPKTPAGYCLVWQRRGIMFCG